MKIPISDDGRPELYILGLSIVGKRKLIFHYRYRILGPKVE